MFFSLKLVALYYSLFAYIWKINYYIYQGHTVFTFVCLCVCLWALSPIGLNGQNDVLFAEKCIRIVCEKLTLFPYGQDIVGNIILLAFWWYSQVQDRSGGFGEMYKYVTLISCKMDLPQHAMQRWHHGIGQQMDHSFVIIVLQIHLADICTLWAPSSYCVYL